jgi:1,4-alpha-glucan branching enzyme
VAGTVVLALHAHLPYVRHPEHEQSLEESWLFEAIADCYLPLLDILERLSKDGVPFRITLSLSPTLVAMWNDALLRNRCGRYLSARCELGERELRRTAGDSRLSELARFHVDRFERCRSWYELRFGRDLAGAFRRLAEAGVLELITTAATHAFLPLLEPRSAVRAQIAVGLDQHRSVFGHQPLGFWLPECGYAAGIDELLAEQGVRYSFLDTHGLSGAKPGPRFGCYAPMLTRAGVAVFARDPAASQQVWSAEVGYPGDASYREFHRDIGFELDAEAIGPALRPAGRPGFTGFKYQRVTGGEPKALYEPAKGLARALEHARHFAQSRVAQAQALEGAMRRAPMVVAPYDAELFGHWWFEGPEFLEAAIREMVAGGLRLRTPGEILRDEPLLQVGAPAESSWGRGGDARTWSNPKTDWIVKAVNRASSEMGELVELVSSIGASAGQAAGIRQAARELLLAQASDWPFMITNGTFAGYAERRVQDHLAAFEQVRLALGSGRPVDELAAERRVRTPLFEDLDPMAFAET